MILLSFPPPFEEHVSRLQLVFDRLRAAGLKVKPTKCSLFHKSVIYLGHRLSAGGVSPDESKYAVVRDWPTPVDAVDVRRFVGFASYYRRFIPRFATIASPLHALTQKNAVFKWTTECDDAFRSLQTLLTEAPILGYPHPDRRFILDTDASSTGMGAVLSQVSSDNREVVIAYASKSLSKSQRNYAASKRELLAVVTFCMHFFDTTCLGHGLLCALTIKPLFGCIPFLILPHCLLVGLSSLLTSITPLCTAQANRMLMLTLYLDYQSVPRLPCR